MTLACAGKGPNPYDILFIFNSFQQGLRTISSNFTSFWILDYRFHFDI